MQASVGTVVGQVSATDAGGDAVTYSITAGNDAGKFAIAANGEISVAGSLAGTSSYTLTVQASDGAHQSTATVTITIPSCSGGAVPNPVNNDDLVEDCETLLGIEDALGGSASLNWSAGLELSQWTGITVGGTPQRVTGLDLSNQNLSGSIPTKIGELDGLRTLNLGNNQLTGNIPAEIMSLTHLTRLAVNNNQLSGRLKDDLGKLTHLTHLELQSNRLGGPLPHGLTDRTGMARLRFGSSGICSPTDTGFAAWLAGSLGQGQRPALCR